MNLVAIDGKKPIIHETAYVDPRATLIGDVIVRKRVGIWPGAVIRGDEAEIILEEGCMILENTVIEAAGGKPVVIARKAIVSHGAIVHGAQIGSSCVIGIGAIVLDGSIIGDKSIVASGALVAPGKNIPGEKLIVGLPGKITKNLTDKDIARSIKEWNLLDEKLDKYKNIRQV